MTIISTIIGIFITNYIICILIEIIPFRNKKVWKYSVVSIFDGLIFLNEILSLFFWGLSIGVEAEVVIESLFGMVGIIIAYILSMMYLNDGKRLFKSKRARNFEKAQKRANPILTKKNIGIIGIVLFVIFLMMLVIAVVYKLRVANIIVLAILMCISLGMIIFCFFLKEGKKMYVLYIKSKSQIRCYKIVTSSIDELKKEIPEISEMYIINEYAKVKERNDVIFFVGFEAEHFEEELLDTIKLDRFDYEEYLDVINIFNRQKRLLVILDENKKIASVKEITK